MKTPPGNTKSSLRLDTKRHGMSVNLDWPHDDGLIWPRPVGDPGGDWGAPAPVPERSCHRRFLAISGVALRRDGTTAMARISVAAVRGPSVGLRLRSGGGDLLRNPAYQLDIHQRPEPVRAPRQPDRHPPGWDPDIEKTLPATDLGITPPQRHRLGSRPSGPGPRNDRRAPPGEDTP